MFALLISSHSAPRLLPRTSSLLDTILTRRSANLKVKPPPSPSLTSIGVYFANFCDDFERICSVLLQTSPWNGGSRRRIRPRRPTPGEDLFTLLVWLLGRSVFLGWGFGIWWRFIFLGFRWRRVGNGRLRSRGRRRPPRIPTSPRGLRVPSSSSCEFLFVASLFVLIFRFINIWAQRCLACLNRQGRVQEVLQGKEPE